MKNIKNLLFVVAMLLMVGCSKDINVKLSESTRNFEAAGGSAEITLESNGAWQVGNCPDWLNISPMSGDGNATLALTCIANMSSQERSAEIKVSTKTNEAILAVKQAFVEGNFIAFTPDSLNCDFQGGDFVVKVEANCDWSIGILPNWLTCEPTSGLANQTTDVNINIQQNASSSESNREYNIDFSAGTDHFHFPIKQGNAQAYHVIPTPGRLNFSSEGGTQTVALQCITAWTLDCNADWISVTPTSGDGNGEISVTVTPNTSYTSRSAGINLTSSVGCSSIVRVTQEAAINPHYLNVNPSALEFPCEGSSLQLTISTDSLWKIKYSEPWISISEETGSGDATITVTVPAYDLLGDRHAQLDIISGTLSQIIPVTQLSCYTEPILSIDPNHLQVDSNHTTVPISISSNTSWSLRMSEDWICSSTMQGTGDCQIDLDIKNNYNQEPRTANVYLCYQGFAYDTLIVEQEARIYHIEANVTELNASSQGDTFVVSVSANQPWSVKTTAAWVHLDPSEGDGDGTFRIVVDANNSIHPRSTEIRLAGEVTGMVSISLSQSN